MVGRVDTGLTRDWTQSLVVMGSIPGNYISHPAWKNPSDETVKQGPIMT